MYYRLLALLHLLALGVAIGAVLLFGVAIAGQVFDIHLVPSRTLSGALNSAILERLMMVLVVCAVIAVATIVPARFAKPRRAGSVAVVATTLFALLVVYLAFWLFPEVDRMRIAIGSFDTILTEKEPLHLRFSELHGRFSLFVRIAWVLALVAFGVSARHAGNPVISRKRLIPVAAGWSGVSVDDTESKLVARQKSRSRSDDATTDQPGPADESTDTDDK